MNNSTKHPEYHWIPKHIFKGFAIDNGMLFEYAKDGGTCRKSPASVCKSAGSFSEDVELLLGSLETHGARVIESLRDRDRSIEVDSVAKRIMAFYIAPFMWFRTPGGRAEAKDGLHEILARYEGGEEAINVNGWPEHVQAFMDGMRERVVADVRSDPDAHFGSQWHCSTVFRWSFFSMSWMVLKFPSETLTIPDCGVIPLGRGMFDPRQEVYLPLSPSRALVMSWKGRPDIIEVVDGRDEHAALINALGFNKAHRFVYAHRRSDEISKGVRHVPNELPTVEPLDSTPQTENPIVPFLPDLNANLDETLVAKFEDGCCMAPKAGVGHQHVWRSLRRSKLLEMGFPELGATMSVCSACGDIRYVFASGEVHHYSTELQRWKFPKRRTPPKNWWETYSLRIRPGQLLAVPKRRRTGR